MDEFLILLQAKLDEVTLDKNVKGKLDQLKKDFSELKIMPVIDPQALSNIVKQLESITGKKITIPNIEFNTGQAVKDVQQLGKQITDSFNQSTKQISLEKEINKQVNSLMESFGIHGKNAFNEIKNALIEYRQELLNTTSSTKAFDDIFDLFADNSSSIDKVTSAIANNMKVANDAKSVYQSLVDYIAQTNKSGSKIYIPNSIKSEYGQDFNSMRSILGSAFTSDTKYKNSLDFENFITELNSQLGNVIDMSHGAEAAFGDLVNKVKSTRGSNYLSVDELFGMGYLNKSEMISKIDSCIDSINQSEKELAQQSSVATDKVVQNEERKQQAYRETANVQKSTQKTTFDLSQNEQKIEQFKNSLTGLGTVDSKYVDNLSERFGKLGIQIQSINASLSEVAVHEKGEYIGTKEILTSTLNGIDKFGQVITLTEAWDQTNHEFVRSLDAVGSSFQNVQKQATNYENKLNDLKTKMSGTDFDTNGFEQTLNQFRNGEVTVNELSSAFNQLKNSADLSLKNLNSRDSSFNQITQTQNNMRDLPTMLDKLEAGMSGLKDKTSLADISVENLRKDFQSLQNVMNSNGGKVPLTDDWISKYQSLMSTVKSAEKQVEALKKVEASDNSQTTKQANYYSTILSNYRQIYSLKQKLLSAGEEETKIIEKQLRSLSASNAANYQQLGILGLKDKDWQSEVDALKKSKELAYDIAVAKQKDKKLSKEQADESKRQAQAEKERLLLLERQRVALVNQAKEKAKTNAQQETNQQKEINAILSKQQSVYKEIWNINKQIAILDPSKNENQISALNEKKRYYQEIYIAAQKELQAYNNISVSQEHLNSLLEIRKKTESEIFVAIAKQNEAQVNKIQLSMGNGTYESKVDALVAKTQQWTDVNGNARISTNELSKAFDQLTTASNNYANSPTEAHQKALIASEKELDKQIKTVTNSVRSMNAELAKDSAISSFRNQVADFMSKNGKTVKSFQFGSELKDIFAKIQQGAKLSNQELAVLKQRFIDVQNAARQTGKLGKTWFQTLREGMSSFSYWTSSTFLVMKAIQSIKGGLGTVKALDTALVDLKKTTTMTNNELEDFYYSSNKVAKQMGVTTEEIINQASAWSRLGYSSAEAASKMAKYSSMFASISPGMNVDTATDGLVSVMKAFDIGNDNPDDVLDGIMSKINIIGNTAATSNAEIVNMLTRSSSAMKEANNTLEETIALETAAVEITRDDASVGTAFKTVAMRIRGRQTLPPYTVMYMLCA